jgi:hypothetical protein
LALLAHRVDRKFVNGLLFLVPLAAGFGIMALGFKVQIPRGRAMNRPALGIALVAGSLFWWLSTAILLAYEGKFNFILNMLTVLTFFVGLAFFFPQPSTATRANQHNVAGTILVWLGFILGLLHPLALIYSATWPARLLQLYAALGLHAAP